MTTLRKADWQLAIAGAALMTLVFATQNGAVLGGAAAAQSNLSAIASQAFSWATWLLLVPLVFEIGARARRSTLPMRTNVAAQVLAGMLVALFHSALSPSLRWAFGMGPRFPLGSVLYAVVPLNFAQDFLRYGLIAAGYHALAYHRESRERDVREAELARRLAEARLESLEGRLQPHFLFNTLNAIAALIRKDPDAASAMLGNLGDLLRASLDAHPGREVTLATELELLDSYTAIQLARFSDRLQVRIDVAPEVRSAYVPQMILQPIVENAVRHGIGPREASGTLTIGATREGDVLRLVVSDDGIGYGRAPASAGGRGLGISGTRARLAHLYGERARFDIAAAAPGTIVTIELPFNAEQARALEVVA